jgi:hypothetical protein
MLVEQDARVQGILRLMDASNQEQTEPRYAGK